MIAIIKVFLFQLRYLYSQFNSEENNVFFYFCYFYLNVWSELLL